MPAYTEFNENDKKNIDSWMQSNGISSNCDVCSDGTYQLRQGVITPQYMDFEGGILSDEGLPIISFECDSCSNLRFFSLYKILPYKVD